MYTNSKKNLEFCPETNLTTPKDVKTQLFKIYEPWMRDLSPEAAYIYSYIHATFHECLMNFRDDFDLITQRFGLEKKVLRGFFVELYNKGYIGTNPAELFPIDLSFVVTHDDYEGFAEFIRDSRHSEGFTLDTANVYIENVWQKGDCKPIDPTPKMNPKLDAGIENKNCFYTVKREWVDLFGWRGAYVLAAIQFHSKPFRRARVCYPLPCFAEKLGMVEEELLTILKKLQEELYIFIYENENKGPSSTNIVPYNCFKMHLRKDLLDSGDGSGWALNYAAPGKVQDAEHEKRIKIAEEMQRVIKKAQEKGIV